MKKVRGLALRADITLPIEGGHDDGRFGIKAGDVVTQSSIHISLLRGGQKDILSETLGWRFMCFSDYEQRSLRAAGWYGEKMGSGNFLSTNCQ